MNPWAELTPRQRQIAELLLQGYENLEIARELSMALRTVKSHFNRMFLRFGIAGGVKRVKLATLLYRGKVHGEKDAPGYVVTGSDEAGSWLPTA